MKRIYMKFDSDTGTIVKEAYLSGELRRMRWVPGTLDTGATLHITLSPDENDTGDGLFVFQITDTGIMTFKHEGDITDTGGTGENARFVGAGDKLTAELRGGGGANQVHDGELWLYYSEKV